MADFRLLHLTDLHVSRLDDRHSFGDLIDAAAERFSAPGSVDRLDAAARFAYENRAEFDAILITGDVGHLGTRRDLDAARRFVDAPAAAPSDPLPPNWVREAPKGWHAQTGGEAQPTLSASGLPVLLFPGNHDRFQETIPKLRAPGGVEFDEVFRDRYWDVGQGVKVFPPLVKGGESLTIVAADCTLRAMSHCSGASGNALHLALIRVTAATFLTPGGCRALVG